MDRIDALRIYQATKGLISDDTEEPAAQLNVIRELCANYGPRQTGAPVPEQGAYWRPPTDFADRAYGNGTLRPISYCRLALIVELLRLGADETAVHLKLWGYVQYAALSNVQREQLTKVARENGLLTGESEGSTQPQQKDVLKDLAATLLRYAVLHYTYEQLRNLLRWLHRAYLPYFDIVLTESASNEAWLANIAELVPRLLLKNLVPIHEPVASEEPKIVLGVDFGFFDNGPARVSSLYRSLFDPDELKALAQEAQRSSELFAHVYPRVLRRRGFFSASDVDGLKSEWERYDRSQFLMEQLVFSTQILNLYLRRDRLTTKMLLEDEYRRFLTIPKFRYDELRQLFETVDNGSSASEAVLRLLDRWKDFIGSNSTADLHTLEQEAPAQASSAEEQELRQRAAAGDSEATVLLAARLASEGRTTEAIAEMEKVINAEDWAEASLLADQGQVEELRRRARAGNLAATVRLAALVAEQRRQQQIDSSNTPATRLLAEGQPVEAIILLMESADNGDSTAGHLLGRLLDEQGGRSEANVQLEKRADAGDLDAHHLLLRMFAYWQAGCLAEGGHVRELRQRAAAGCSAGALLLAGLLAEQGRVEELRAEIDAGNPFAADHLRELETDRADLTIDR